MRVRECASKLSETECGAAHWEPKQTLFKLNIDHRTIYGIDIGIFANIIIILIIPKNIERF